MTTQQEVIHTIQNKIGIEFRNKTTRSKIISLDLWMNVEKNKFMNKNRNRNRNRNRNINEFILNSNKLVELNNYIDRYTKIARFNHVNKMFKYIYANFHILFNFTPKIKKLIKEIEKKKFEFINDINECLHCGKYTRKQKHYLLSALKTFNRKMPQRSHFIGNVLNRVFIKDVALHITEFI